MSIVVSLPAGRPKRDIIEIAFDDCGLAGYEFDRTPEEQTIALRKLNALMLEWPWNKLGYVQPVYGVGQAEEPSGLDDKYVHAVAQYLALRIAPGIGASLQPEQRASMARSLATLQAEVATVPEVEVPVGYPRGHWRWRGW
jgi:hypothetical protein